MFEHLSISPDIESIFYADLFLINGKVWMITGCGKSKAARLATKKAKNCDLTRDCVALTRVDNSLYGSFDPGAIFKDVEKKKQLQSKYKIDVIAHCLDMPQTIVHKMLSGYKPLWETDNKKIGILLAHYPYPAYMANEYVNEETLAYLNNPERRINKFVEITNNITDTQFLLVSWMPGIEEKSKLYLSI